MAFEWLGKLFGMGPSDVTPTIDRAYTGAKDKFAQQRGYPSGDAYKEAMGAKYQQMDPNTIGSMASGDNVVFGQGKGNPTQNMLERIHEMRSNYYYGGTPNGGNAAAENAINTGNLYAGGQSGTADIANQRSAQIFGRGYGPEGPSAAQAMLRQGTNEALGSQLALARSGRGMGESASALDAAGRNAVGLQANAANAAATLRAQEAENYAQRRDAAQRANDAAALGYSQAALQGYSGAGTTAMGGQQLANNIQGQVLQGNQGYEQNLTQLYGIDQGVGVQKDAASAQKTAAEMAAIGTMIGAAASDENAKIEKQKLSSIDSFKDSSGAFDPLSKSQESDASRADLNAGVQPVIQLPAARNTGHPAHYAPVAQTSFAQSLGAGDASNLGQPGAQLVDPWGTQQPLAKDPWAEYLTKRAQTEQQQADSDKEAKQRQSAVGNFMGLAGLGMLLAKLSDINSKDEIEKLAGAKRKARGAAKRSGQRLAQDPRINIPAVSQRPSSGDMLSDENSKTTIQSLAAENAMLKRQLSPPSPDAGNAAALQAVSEDAIRRGGAYFRPFPQAALQTVQQAPGYSYRYKEPGAPGAAPGKHFGPMAQDLERTPAGASTVATAPDGTKMVDPGRLTLVNTAALHAQQQQIEALQAQLDGLSGKRGSELRGLSGGGSGSAAGSTAGSAVGRIFASRGM